MMRTIEYVKKQDELIKKYILKASRTTTKKALARTFKDFFIEATVLGIASSETDIELLGKKHLSERASKSFRIVLSDVKKTKSITDRASEFWDKYSLKLAGEFEDYRLREVEKMFRDKIKEGGWTRKELLKEVEEKLQIKSKVRLDMIVTTEMTKCFNYARVENAKENAKNGGIVRALKFNAVMDIHTSPTCQSRNGLVLAIDDPRIGSNTPPLHVRCRSIWTYVDKWDWEELYNGRSSLEWDNRESISKTQPDNTWGNAFAYGGEKETASFIKFDTEKDAKQWFKKNGIEIETGNRLDIVNELGTIRESLGDYFPPSIKIEKEIFEKYNGLKEPALFFKNSIYINPLIEIKNWEKISEEQFKKGYWASSDKKSIIAHEIGHYLHKKKDPSNYLAIRNYIPTDEELDTMGKISIYSQENPIEFVAEVYALLLLGEKDKITNEILMLFYQFGGRLL